MPAALELDYEPDLARERIADCVRDKQHQAPPKAKRTAMSFVAPRRVPDLLQMRFEWLCITAIITANVGRISLPGASGLTLGRAHRSQPWRRSSRSAVPECRLLLH